MVGFAVLAIRPSALKGAGVFADCVVASRVGTRAIDVSVNRAYRVDYTGPNLTGQDFERQILEPRQVGARAKLDTGDHR